MNDACELKLIKQRARLDAAIDARDRYKRLYVEQRDKWHLNNLSEAVLIMNDLMKKLEKLEEKVEEKEAYIEHLEDLLQFFTTVDKPVNKKKATV